MVTSPPSSVAIVGDQELLRQGLELLFAASPQLDIVYSGGELSELAGIGLRPDLILLDLNLQCGTPDRTTITGLVQSGSKVLVVSSSFAQPCGVRAMLDAGVENFVATHDSHTELLHAIESVLAGKQWVTARLANCQQDASVPVHSQLSARERQVLALYASGTKIPAIARTLGISAHTVREYLKRIRAKFAATGHGARTRTELYREAIREGLIEP